MNFIIETNWINKPLWKGIREHYQAVNQACGSIEGAELIGLFKPLNEPWNWTHFMKVDTPEKWRQLDREIRRLYPAIDDDVSYSISRIYWGLETGRHPPPIRDPASMKYLVMDLGICNEVKVVQEYYNLRCDQFEGLEGAGILGFYAPLTDIWSWAMIKLFDSMSRFLETGMEYTKTHGRRPEIIISIQRVYERYEP